MWKEVWGKIFTFCLATKFAKIFLFLTLEFPVILQDFWILFFQFFIGKVLLKASELFRKLTFSSDFVVIGLSPGLFEDRISKGRFSKGRTTTIPKPDQKFPDSDNKWFGKVAAISWDCKWLGFWISNHIQNSDNL